MKRLLRRRQARCAARRQAEQVLAASADLARIAGRLKGEVDAFLAGIRAA
jgi:hypothetical protein